jgi:CheY-like chemotaxis protein
MNLASRSDKWTVYLSITLALLAMLASTAFASLGSPERELRDRLDESMRGQVLQMSEPEPIAKPSSAPSRDTVLGGMCFLVLALIIFRNCAERIGRTLVERDQTPEAGRATAAPAQQEVEVFVSAIPSEAAPAPVAESEAVCSYRENTPGATVALAELAGKILSVESAAERVELATELYLGVHGLQEHAAATGLMIETRLLTALQNLLGGLVKRPNHFPLSSLSTAREAIELIGVMAREPEKSLPPPVRVLAVEDDAVSRRALRTALVKVCEHVQIAASAEAALLVAEQEPFDLILLDVQLPGMSGFQACKKIRQGEVNNRTPIIFVTGQTDVAARVEAAAAGGNGFIAKPAYAAEISLAALAYALRGRLDSPAQHYSALLSLLHKTTAHETAAPVP